MPKGTDHKEVMFNKLQMHFPHVESSIFSIMMYRIP
jgi:hypothetical protein